KRRSTKEIPDALGAELSFRESLPRIRETPSAGCSRSPRQSGEVQFFNRSTRRDRRVVDQDVDRAEPPCDAPCPPLKVLGRRDIRLQGYRAALGPPDQRDHFFRPPLFLAVIHRDRCSCRSKAHSDGAADSTTCPGNERNAPIDVHA